MISDQSETFLSFVEDQEGTLLPILLIDSQTGDFPLLGQQERSRNVAHRL